MFFNVCLHSSSFPLRAEWRKSDSSVGGKPQGNRRWNSNSRDVVANCPSFSRRATRAPRRVCSQAKKRIQALLETFKADVGRIIYEKRKRTIPLKTSHSLNLDKEQTNLKITFLEVLSPKFMTLTFSLSLQERPPKPDIPWLTEHMWNTCCDLEVRLVCDLSTPTYSQRQNSIVLRNLVRKILNRKCNFSTG